MQSSNYWPISWSKNLLTSTLIGATTPSIAGTKCHRLVTPDKKKYAAYYHALKQRARLEQQWRNEDQRNLHRLVNIREFLWT